MTATLPDLLKLADGTPVRTEADWRKRRQELLDMLLDIEYGPLPPTPKMDWQEMHAHTLRNWPGVRHSRHRLWMDLSGGRFALTVELFVPPSQSPPPVVLSGDGCWRSLSDNIIGEIVGRGYAVAQFDRTEIVPDKPQYKLPGTLREALPEHPFAALGAWAWGYHRCVDWLSCVQAVDASRIVAVGHSRGGKTALLAGATDERIAMTCANGSGCGGAGSFHVQHKGSENIADITTKFPHWFSPRLNAYAGRQDQLPFDQHALKALVAPRCLLTTEARGDLWANPAGAYLTHQEARKVYELLGCVDRIGTCCRDGKHMHAIQDWRAMLDFMDWHFAQKPPHRSFDQKPT